MRESFAVLLAVSLLLGGCAPARISAPRPSGLVSGYYDHPPVSFKPTLISKEDRSGYSFEKWELAFPDPAQRPIRLDWYRTARPGRRPLVIMSPILAGNDLYIREFAPFYAARGMHGVIIYRQKEIFSADRPLSDMEGHFRQTVIEMRQALDWLERQEAVDPQRIGSFAISLGAILSVILAAVDPRIRCSVFGLPAGHLAEVIMSSQDKAIRKRRKAFLEKNGWDEKRGLEELKKTIISEPMRLAGTVKPDRTLMIIGLFDRVLGFERSLSLWRALGRPQLIVLPTGHYTAYLATPYLKLVTYSFLSKQLDA